MEGQQQRDFVKVPGMDV